MIADTGVPSVRSSRARWWTYHCLTFLGALLALGLVEPASPTVAQDQPAQPAAPAVDGVRLRWIEAGGVAERGGLQVGDVIRRVNDRTVRDDGELFRFLESAAPGQPIRIGYCRGEAERETTLVPEGRYKVTYAHAPRVVARRTVQPPTITRLDGRMRLDVPAPPRILLSLAPAEQSRIWVRAAGVQVEEFPARGRYPRRIVYRFQGDVEARVAPDLVIRGPRQAELVWTDQTGHTQLHLGERERGAGSSTRWHGWGLLCWDYEGEKLRDHVGSWRLAAHWGFSPPYPLTTIPTAEPPAPDPEAMQALGARVHGLMHRGFSYRRRGAKPRADAPPTPAERAGLAAGDLIVAVDGQPIAHPADLQEIMERSRAGQHVHIRYRRGAESRETTLVVEADTIPRPRQPERPARPLPAPPTVTRAAGRVLVTVPGPVRLDFGSIPGHAPAVSGLADDVKLEAVQQYVYHLRGHPELRLTPEIALRSRGPTALNWSGWDGSIHIRVRRGSDRTSRGPRAGPPAALR